MTDRSDTIERLALRVAEGQSVDWGHELASHPEERGPIENLRRIAEVAAPTVPVEPSRAGSRLGAWGHLRLLEELGAGSFGTVYRAFDPVLQRDVALKLRKQTGSTDGAGARSFIEEARRLARVRHPHVLGVHGADVHGGLVGLWAELLPKRTLEDELSEGGPARLARVLAIGQALASALAAVHEAGLVHGDVKATNVADEDGRVVLVDFGAGADLGSEAGEGGAFGSPLTLAPERLEGAPLRPAVDAYGLGVLLFRLLNGGRYPVEAATWDELVTAHRGNRSRNLDWRRSPGGLRPPHALRRLVEQLLSPDPDERPSASQTLERLEWIARAPARRRRRAAVAAVLGSLILGTAVSTVAYLRTRAARAESEAINDFLTEMLAAPRGVMSGRQVRVVDVLDDAAQELDALGDGSAAQTRVQQVLGATYLALQQPRDAEPLLRDVAQRLVAREGRESPAALAARAQWADALLGTGNKEEAQKIALEIADTDVEASGDADERPFGPRFAEILLARIDRDDGRYEAAETRLRSILDDPQLDRARYLAENDLARLWMESGRFEKARPLLEPKLERLRKTRGMRHSDTLTTANLLGICLSNLGEYAAAASLLREIADVADDWLGEDHDYSLAARGNLAAALKESGQTRAALEIEQALLPLLAKTKGPEALETLRANTNLCLTLRQVGRLDDAAACSRELTPRLNGALGERHPVTLIHGVNYAELLLEAGRPRPALALARSTRAGMASTFGEESPVLLVVDTIVGAALAETGERAAGLAKLRETLEAQRRADGPSDLQTLTTQLRLGAALCSSQGSSSAEERAEGSDLLEDARSLARAAFASGHPLLADLEHGLSSC